MEEEDLRFGAVNMGARDRRKVAEQRFQMVGFLDRRVAVEHGIINKLLMRGGRGVVDRDSFEVMRKEGLLNVPS